MAEIQNSEVYNQFGEDTKLPPQDLPRNLHKEIMPVLSVKPDKICNIARENDSTTTGAVTVFLTPSNKDFYLCNAQISLSSDATADNIQGVLSVTIDGAERHLILLTKQTTTVIHLNQGISFNFPLKIDRNTNIRVQTAFTVGSCRYGGTIVGYTVESYKKR